jgi:hypothetical protein
MLRPPALRLFHRDVILTARPARIGNVLNALRQKPILLEEPQSRREGLALPFPASVDGRLPDRVRAG